MRGQTSRRIRSARLAQRLRASMTDAERKLWSALRNRGMRGWRFRRQHPFGDYILDFVCLEAGLVIEVDGSQHMDSLEYDRVRTSRLEAAGLRVLRFWNDEVLASFDLVCERIWQELSADCTRHLDDTLLHD